jgi:dienelactone hydrolase
VTIRHRLIEYRDGDTVLEGRLSWDDSMPDQRPGILVSHTIAGRAALEERKADQLAALGYVAFALDLYGKGVRGETPSRSRSYARTAIAGTVDA